MTRWIIGFVVALFSWAGVSTAFADVCVQGAVQYRLQIGVAGDAIVINGIRGPGILPIVGSGFVDSSGGVVVAFNETFDWGTGAWIHPLGTTVLRFPSFGSTSYDTTYHGNGNVPNTFLGVVTVIACGVPPGPSEDAGGGPNAQ